MYSLAAIIGIQGVQYADFGTAPQSALYGFNDLGFWNAFHIQGDLMEFLAASFISLSIDLRRNGYN